MARLVKEVLVENGDNAALTAAMFVGGEAVVSSMGLGHAPAACVRHGAIARGVNGAVLRTDEAVRERWERMVAARLDDGDGGRLSCKVPSDLRYDLYGGFCAAATGGIWTTAVVSLTCES